MPSTEYSHSRLSTFENCPRQFEFRYVKRVPRETESIEAFLGKRVHEVLERLYHHVGRYGRPPSLRQVLDRYRGDWNLHWHENVEIVRDDRDAESYRTQGERCLETYYRARYPFEEGETVGLERRIKVRLDDDGRYRAQGVIDRLSRAAPGHYEIHDYKTGGWLPPRDRLGRDRQLPLYQIGVQQTFPDAERVDLVWHFLTFGRTVRMTREPSELETVREETIARIDEVESAPSYPPRPGPLCRWCEYRALCPDAAGGRAAPDGAARSDPPVSPGAAPSSPRMEQLPLLRGLPLTR